MGLAAMLEMRRKSSSYAIVVPPKCQNISLYEPEQSLSLSQDEGEQC